MAGNQLCYSDTQTAGIPKRLYPEVYLYISSPSIPEDLFVTKRVNIPLPAWWCHSWECRMFTHLVTHTKTPQDHKAIGSNKESGFAELEGLRSLDILGKCLLSTCADYSHYFKFFFLVSVVPERMKVQFKECLFCCIDFQSFLKILEMDTHIYIYIYIYI